MSLRSLALAAALVAAPMASVASADIAPPPDSGSTGTDSGPAATDAGSEEGSDGGCAAAPGESGGLAVLGLFAAGALIVLRRRG